jgi:N4-(beta-N-acetylglucosaminyl)-L-asparaginase
MKRKTFLQRAAASGVGLMTSAFGLVSAASGRSRTESTPAGKSDLPSSAPASSVTATQPTSRVSTRTSNPLIIATWNVPNATGAAFERLQQGGSALDAVEAGCRVEEADPGNSSVGYGGLPDRDGQVTLDACIMDERGRYGSVVYLQQIKHPISVARKVMEETPHVMMAGSGALKFALQQGFPAENLLTESSRKAWEEWKITSEYKPIINIENHDTIGMLVRSADGTLSGGCTTSGLAYKMDGRIGDSPIIGSGLFVDNEIGAATATGLGEEVLKTVGSFLIVELMRQGSTPQQACEEAVRRILEKQPPDTKPDFQVGYIAINKKGETGAFGIHPGFGYTVHNGEENRWFDAASRFS